MRIRDWLGEAMLTGVITFVLGFIAGWVLIS